MRQEHGNLVQVSLPRTGLGHALVSYARAYWYYAEGQADFVHPLWFKIRIGPYIRREADKRNYHRIIRTPEGWGHPWWVAVRRLGMNVVTEDSFRPESTRQFLVVRDDGPLHPRTTGTFRLLHPHRERLAQALQSLSRAPAAPERQLGSIRSIGVFHRSGDMRQLQPQTQDLRARRTHGYGYYPPEYAAEALRTVRRIAGWQVPAVLSTDATGAEIGPIMEEGLVTVSSTKSALFNMLDMRRHSVLVMGTSMYSRWAWFLGDALAVTPRYKDEAHHLLGIEERPYAWFVTPEETSLADPGIQSEIRQRLAR